MSSKDEKMNKSLIEFAEYIKDLAEDMEKIREELRLLQNRRY